MFRRPFLRRPLFRAAVIGGAGYVLGRQAARNAAQAQPAPAPLPVNPSVVPAADPIDRLKELSALHDAGKLTDEEFAAAKRNLLGL